MNKNGSEIWNYREKKEKVGGGGGGGGVAVV